MDLDSVNYGKTRVSPVGINSVKYGKACSCYRDRCVVYWCAALLRVSVCVHACAAHTFVISAS